MFTLSRTTADDQYLIERLNGKPLSGGIYVEIHVSSLVHEALTTKSDVSETEIRIPKGSTITRIKKVQETKKKEDKEEEYKVDRVSFTVNGIEYIASEGAFSMIMKRCFQTKRSTVCFSLRDEDKPQN